MFIALWATFFVEWWRVREQTLGLRFGTRNSFCVEKRRAQYKPGFSWWQREFRMLLTVPVIVAFGGILVAVLTATFFFDAFITSTKGQADNSSDSLLPSFLSSSRLDSLRYTTPSPFA
jgi:anoctamin-10